jgi:transposase InsO family protein
MEQPEVGVRKLHRMLRSPETPNLIIGRDYLFELLAAKNLLVKTKRKFIHTTDSGHSNPVYPNLLSVHKIIKVNQAWVVDITYLNTCDGFVYLYLITDRYSRRIISHVVADSLKAKHACDALQAAIKSVRNTDGIIHHSDHGSQYCSQEYQKILAENGMRSSMTGPSRCYDNAVAERVNGILKHEFGLSKVLPSLKLAKELAADSIKIYNSKRLHTALQYKTPDLVYYAA